jgi:hypothetical protein
MLIEIYSEYIYIYTDTYKMFDTTFPQHSFSQDFATSFSLLPKFLNGLFEKKISFRVLGNLSRGNRFRLKNSWRCQEILLFRTRGVSFGYSDLRPRGIRFKDSEEIFERFP